MGVWGLKRNGERHSDAEEDQEGVSGRVGEGEENLRHGDTVTRRRGGKATIITCFRHSGRSVAKSRNPGESWNEVTR